MLCLLFARLSRGDLSQSRGAVRGVEIPSVRSCEAAAKQTGCQHSSAQLASGFEALAGCSADQIAGVGRVGVNVTDVLTVCVDGRVSYCSSYSTSATLPRLLSWGRCRRNQVAQGQKQKRINRFLLFAICNYVAVLISFVSTLLKNIEGFLTYFRWINREGILHIYFEGHGAHFKHFIVFTRH